MVLWQPDSKVIFNKSDQSGDLVLCIAFMRPDVGNAQLRVLWCSNNSELLANLAKLLFIASLTFFVDFILVMVGIYMWHNVECNGRNICMTNFLWESYLHIRCVKPTENKLIIFLAEAQTEDIYIIIMLGIINTSSKFIHIPSLTHYANEIFIA